MNKIMDVLKNNLEISFEMIGESYAYFIIYQFLGKLINSEDDLLKYKENNISERSEFLFTFILNNIKFSPFEFFQLNNFKI